MVNVSLLFKIASLLFLGAQFLFTSANATEESEAIKTAVNALKRTPAIEAIITDKKKSVKHRTQKMAQEMDEYKYPLGTLGVLAKVAIEGRVGHKFKVSKDTAYTLDVKKSGEIRAGIDWRHSKNNYDFVVFSRSNDTGLKFGIKLSFD